MRFKYEAYSSGGETVRGVLEADSETQAEEVLWGSDLTILTLKSEDRFALPSLDEAVPTLFGVKRQDVINFTHQLATLLGAGVAIVPALAMLYEQATKAAFRKVLRQINDTVQAGNRLSDAFSQHPTIFPPLYLRLMEVGEATGNMEVILRQMATYMEKEAATGRKIRGAMGYPIFVLLLAAVALTIMLNLVLPAIGALFKEFGGQLPLATRIMLGLVGFSQAYFRYAAPGILGTGALVFWYIRTPTGRKRWDTLMFWAPIIGTINRNGSIARFARTASILLGAGVSLTETIELVVQATQNQVVRDALVGVRSDVLAGQALSVSLSQHPAFPPLINQMVNVGERTGTLEANLGSMADFFDTETDRAISRLTGMIEPGLIVMVGLFVGFVAVAVISPMYSIMQQIR